MKCYNNQHTSRSPYITIDNNGFQLWKYKPDGSVDSGAIIGDDGTIYFGSKDSYLYALNSTGYFKWRFDTGENIWSTPAVDEGGILYIGSYDGYLYSIYPNGTLKWKFKAGMFSSISSSPAIGNDGTIYFGVMGPEDIGRIYAVKPNGQEKWHYDTGYWITSDPAIGTDGTIYIGSGDTYFYAMHPNGTLHWRFKTGHYIKGPPSIASDGTIYIGSYDDYLYALFPDGALKWKTKIGKGTETNPSIGSDGTIYVGGDDLYAIYPNGTMKWIFDPGPGRDIHQSSPAISADDIIYFGTNIGSSGGEIISVNKNGTERWRHNIADNWVDSSPCIGEDGTVYIGSSIGFNNGYFYAFGRGPLEVDANGPYTGFITEPIRFSGHAAGGYSPYVWYWNFGDGHTSNQQSPQHQYTQTGNYTVTLTVSDSGEEPSTVTNTTYAIIQDYNTPPSPPDITGSSRGRTGTTYTYSFSIDDPDDDNLFFFVDWDDNSNSSWIGPYPSGSNIQLDHTWTDDGSYVIKAKARDEHGLQSTWANHPVTMPINKWQMFIHYLFR